MIVTAKIGVIAQQFGFSTRDMKAAVTTSMEVAASEVQRLASSNLEVALT